MLTKDEEMFCLQTMPHFDEVRHQSTFTVQGPDKNHALKEAEIAGCLQAENQDNPRSSGTTLGQVSSLSASDSQRSRPFPARSSDTDTRMLPTMEPQPSLIAIPCQTLTFSAADFLAKAGRLLESGKDLRTPEGLCFLRSHGFYPTNDPDIFCLRTLKVYLVLTAERLSRKYLGFSPNSVIAWKQLFLTASTTAFPKTGRECFLSDILETDVSEKYFLSQRMTENLMKRSPGYEGRFQPVSREADVVATCLTSRYRKQARTDTYVSEQ